MLCLKNMFKKQWGFVLLAVTLQACSVGLDGGSIEKSFIGIQEATVMGPETVEISWITNKNCNTYQIYSLSKSSSDFIQEAALPPVKLDKNKITSDTLYVFSVACVKDGNKSGQDVTLAATTWNKFNGEVTSSLNTAGQNPQIELDWNYRETTGTEFRIYAKKSSVPGDLSDWILTSNIAGDGYVEEPICTTSQTKLSIGQGGDCNPAGLVPGESYNFKVVAKYPDGTFSYDLKGVGTNQSLPASFQEPKCVLTQAGLGADVNTSYLFLRCGTDAFAASPACVNFEVKAYQSMNGTRSIISDLLSGAGTLRVQPKIDSSANNSRLVEGLEIEYTCINAQSQKTKMVVRYDQSSGSHKKPVLKYGNSLYEKAPIQAYQENPSKVGSAIVTGDFNCNGKPDLAIGLPDVTYNSSPYFNRNNSSGVVKVIYDYVGDATSAINLNNLTLSSGKVQYLSFRDLPAYAKFGKTLSVGNINKDIAKDVNSNYFNCDDLIIGAPGNIERVGRTSFTGAAFIFYGHPQRFPQPLDYSGLSANAPTCTGNFDSQVCTPVRLSPDVTKWMKVDPRYTSQGTDSNFATGGMNSWNAGSLSSFGFQVSYIRDFNADGYGDVAISDPYCDMDGEVAPGYVLPGQGGQRLALQGVGCVYVYWGGPGGLRLVNMGRTPDGLSNLTSPFAIVYPPIPQAGMHFGWSLSGGGDVNVAPPVPVKMNGTDKLILANGNDFIVGAPDFNYKPTTAQLGQATLNFDSSMGPTSFPDWTVNESQAISQNDPPCGTNCQVDPIVLTGPTQFDVPTNVPVATTKMTPPWNLAWSNQRANWTNPGAPYPSFDKLRDSTGIAFLYLGRSPIKTYEVNLTSGFNKFPNLLTDGPANFDLLSRNLFHRQNGSSNIEGGAALSNYDYNPQSSFYNCGSRGNNRWANANGLYKGISCLAGRNNVSWIYPALNSNDLAVTKFGSSVTIAGSKEQNLIALYELGTQADYLGYSLDPDTSVMTPRKQGIVHESIRGTSLWEVSVKRLNYPANSFESEMVTTTGTTDTTTTVTRTGVLSRSALEEKYTFNGITTKDYFPQTDSNNDGYADVAIGTNGGNNNKIFGYYGNYAADFAYHQNSNSVTCSITKDPWVVPGSSSDTPKYMSITSTLGSDQLKVASDTKAYSVFSAFARMKDSSTANDISYRFPYYFYPTNGIVRLRDLNDTGNLQSYSFNYSDITRSAGSKSDNAKTSCKPIMKSASSGVSVLTSADMNSDGYTDLLSGMPANSTENGKTVLSVGGVVGFGNDTQFMNVSERAKIGSSIAANNWKFINETRRRDLFSGAPGQDQGSGMIYHYMAEGTNALSNSANTSITENSNFPNDLRAERSKLIGDINGDSKEDILVPVRRIGSGGTLYYDAIINFGSEFGSVTYQFCKDHLNQIKKLDQSFISLSDCLGNDSPVAAKIGTSNIMLPQYIHMPSGVGVYWILNSYAAGDVNNDSFEDLLLVDFTSTTDNNNVAKLYLYFGSSSGLRIGNSPVRGKSLNLSPQLISSAIAVSNGYLGDSRRPNPSFFYLTNPVQRDIGLYQASYQNTPITVGDYNGDGYKDLAIGVPSSSIPGHNNVWKCSSLDRDDPNNSACFRGFPPNNNNAATASSPGSGHGAVMVLYGSTTGYQTPMDQNNNAVEYPSLALSNCKDFYQFGSANTCLYSDGNPTLSSVAEVYDVLNYSNGWNLKVDRAACDASNDLASLSCKTTMIRNPVYYDYNADPQTGNSISFYMRYMNFGSSLTTADINKDGVDDLLVGSPSYWLPGYVDNGGNPANSLEQDLTTSNATIPNVGRGTGNQSFQGRVFIYYGAKKLGLVAPNAKQMVGDIGLGIKNDTTNVAMESLSTIGNIPFAIYPKTTTFNNLIPPLDRNNGSASFDHRNFGVNISSGDFNGDGNDDVAVVSAKGQLYVYYGPVCAFDNSKAALDSNTEYGMYVKPNLLSEAQSAASENKCTKVDLKISPSTTDDITGLSTPAISGVKAMPQMITVQGASGQLYFGSMLLSRRPVRGSTGLVVSNPGNINGDIEGTSELVIGGSYMNDPNVSTVSGKYTGVGYVLMGHRKAITNTDMPTQPGLFVGNPTYNSSIMSIVTNNVTQYQYSPIILRPHSGDGLTGWFMRNESTLGDINGDGIGDLVMPSSDLQFGADNTPIIDGGGFKLFY